jgi:uncharacterized protein YrzB (UPF0473 family)
MTDIEKNGCNCGDNHDHCECEGEECNCNTITLDMEDGTQKDFMVLDILEHEGKQYIALAEVDSMEYDIMSMVVDGENVELSVIEDDDEFNAVAARFEEQFQSDDEEPED